MSERIVVADNGRVKDGYVHFTALPYPLPPTYRKLLTDVGIEIAKRKNQKKGYADLAAELDAIEKNLRQQFGVPHSYKIPMRGGLLP